MKEDKEALYQESFARIKKAIGCEPVDRVPVIYMGLAFAPRFSGISIAKYCSDPEAAISARLETMKKIGGFDGCLWVGSAPTALQAAAWLSHVRVPGKELPDDSLWQIEEAEVMTIDDYDKIIENGWNNFMMSYLPRVIDMAEFGEQISWNINNGPRLMQLYRDNGYVGILDSGLMPIIPFESFCGGRSMQKFMFDLYRIPDKVEAAMKVSLEEGLAVIEAAPPARPGMIGGGWVGGWRSASAMLAPKLWDRFVWPYIVKYVDAMVNKGYTPVLHWDQDWTRDLSRLQELPAKKVVLNPDGMTDVRKFREIVGDRMSLLGDVPSSLFAAGTPDDVYNYVRDLVSDIGTTGLLLCPGCDAPINTKPENMQAFVTAGRDLGGAN